MPKFEGMSSKAAGNGAVSQGKDAGPGGKRTRPPRMNNLPQDNDEQTELEVAMAGSGRSDAWPHEGLAGAHHERRQPRGEPLEADQHSAADEPIGEGSEVAPTEKAEIHERERHRLQRELGVVPAGEDGNLRQRRAPGATREALDAAAREADRLVK
jgi:hypothetical protein